MGSLGRDVKDGRLSLISTKVLSQDSLFYGCFVKMALFFSLCFNVRLSRWRKCKLTSKHSPSFGTFIFFHFSLLQGLPKVKETFMGAVKAIFRVFFNTYGSVRVDFAQPFSLKVRAKSKLLIYIFSLKKCMSHQNKKETNLLICECFEQYSLRSLW